MNPCQRRRKQQCRRKTSISLLPLRTRTEVYLQPCLVTRLYVPTGGRGYAYTGIDVYTENIYLHAGTYSSKAEHVCEECMFFWACPRRRDRSLVLSTPRKKKRRRELRGKRRIERILSFCFHDICPFHSPPTERNPDERHCVPQLLHSFNGP